MKNVYPKSVINHCLFFIVLFLCNCKKDSQILNDRPLTMSSKLLKSHLSASANIDFVTSDSYYIENSLPSDYITDGSKDYTTFVQQALDENRNCVFPNFPILINKDGLNIPSNRTLTFLPGSVLVMQANSEKGYGVLEMRNVSNINLINPVLIGDRDDHTGKDGEFGMGISIYGSSNIKVLNPIVSEMWGDGIYIGMSENVIPKNITIKDAILKHNRRDGLTITAVDGLIVDSPYAGFSDGTKPMAGIAFEPNDSHSEIKNVVISNALTEGNTGTGMFVDFGNLMGGGQKKVNVLISNHTDIKSGIGMKAFSRITDGGGSTIQGTLKFTNPKWSGNSKKALQTILYGENDVHLLIDNPIITDENDRMLLKDETLVYMKHKTRINKDAWSSITFSNNWPNSTSPPPPVPNDSPNSSMVYAIHAGGEAYKASDGIEYQADNAFTGGQVFNTQNSIANTSDDKLYQTERYGNFGYALPIADGTYEIKFKFAEIYHTGPDRRQFNVYLESEEVINDWDIYKEIGNFKAFDISRTVKVTDGTLNIDFTSNIDYAKVSAFYVVKK